MKRFGFFAISFVLFARLVSAAEPQVNASLDRDQARVNEEVHLSIKITGVRGSLQAPKLPSLEGFEIFYSGRASHFSFVNGQTESMTEFDYVLVPRSTGRFVLRPIEITIDGKIYQTPQLEIRIEDQTPTLAPRTVTPQPAIPQTPQSGRSQTAPFSSRRPNVPTLPQPASPTTAVPSGAVDEGIFLKVHPSKLTVYANEQVLLAYSLYTRYDTRYEGFEQEPETSGFWTEEFPMDQDLGKDTEIVNGNKYVRADIRKMALFPTAPGEYWIKPGTIKASVQIQEQSSSLFDEFFNDSFFSGAGLFARRVDKRLTHEPIKIMVKPLPETGKPASFKGVVGDFKMATALDKRVVNQNEALTLSIAIEGEGNVETIRAPEIPEIPDTKVYESDTKTQLYRLRNVIAGKKTFEVILIPARAGELTIPSLEFSFFSPRLERYVILKSDPAKVMVNPSSTPPPMTPKEVLGAGESDLKKSIRLESEDIRYLKEELGKKTVSYRDLIVWLGAGNVVMTLVSLLIFAARKRDEFLNQNLSLKRTLFAKKYARQGLRRLERLIRSSETGAKTTEEFFDESTKILNQYLADKLNLSSHGLTQEIVERHLALKNASPEIISKIRASFEICDRVRFGKMLDSGDDRKQMVDHIKTIIEALEHLP